MPGKYRTDNFAFFLALSEILARTEHFQPIKAGYYEKALALQKQYAHLLKWQIVLKFH